MPEPSTEEFSAFGRAVIDLLHTVVDAMLAEAPAKETTKRDSAVLLAKIENAARRVAECSSVEEARELLKQDHETGLAICWLNAALPPPYQMKAMHLAFERASQTGAPAPWQAFSAYLLAMRDTVAEVPPIVGRN